MRRNQRLQSYEVNLEFQGTVKLRNVANFDELVTKAKEAFPLLINRIKISTTLNETVIIIESQSDFEELPKERILLFNLAQINEEE